ncbi:sterol desaturase family protein [Ruegeria sp.]|uniref:sterol desaturase family protein n=1 Tax=Ruegeria sp. TaxID=1879320 RepID=UPI003C7A54D0
MADYISEVLANPFALLANPSYRLSYVYLATALIAAIFVFFRSQDARRENGFLGLLDWLLPWDVLTHKSAKADYVMFFVNKSVILAIYASILIQSPFWYDVVAGLLGPAPVGPSETSWYVSAIYTVTLILALDAALWFGHYIFHKIPILWEFHKVHHSAEVMTPLTASRMHPLEEAVSAIFGGFAIGVVFALLDQYFGTGARIFKMFDINIFLFVFFLAAFNLRHSHVWLQYPNWLQHIFVSPAQHQIHHSKAKKHWDKNMGFIFSLWDWSAGTLYSPKSKENLDYGLGNGEDGTWNNALVLYFRPFKNAFNLARQGWRAALVSPQRRKKKTKAHGNAEEAPKVRV